MLDDFRQDYNLWSHGGVEGSQSGGQSLLTWFLFVVKKTSQISFFGNGEDTPRVFPETEEYLYTGDLPAEAPCTGSRAQACPDIRVNFGNGYTSTLDSVAARKRISPTGACAGSAELVANATSMLSGKANAPGFLNRIPRQIMDYRGMYTQWYDPSTQRSTPHPCTNSIDNVTFNYMLSPSFKRIDSESDVSDYWVKTQQDFQVSWFTHGQVPHDFLCTLIPTFATPRSSTVRASRGQAF